MKYILGIDFGTTTTAVGMTSESSRFEPEIIEIDGIKTVETVLRLDFSGEKTEQIGEEAWREISLYPDRTFFAFKPKTGTDYQFIFTPKNRIFSARELGILFLRVIREKIEHQQFNDTSLHDLNLTCVIGYPAEWTEDQKKTLTEMAEEAGFPNIIGCEEPVGVVYYHHFKGDIDINKEQTILVYDFGGGTTDVAVVRTGKGRLPEVIGFGGTDVGGYHFDEKLRTFFSLKISMSHGMAQLNLSDQAMIRRYARMLKEKLSVARDNGSDKAEVTIPMLETSKTSQRILLNTAEFEKQCAELIDRFEEPVRAVLDKFGIKNEDIGISIIAGGSGRLYYVREKFKQLFPESLRIYSTNPQEVISKGLTLFGRAKTIGVEEEIPAEHRESSEESATENTEPPDNKGEDPFKNAEKQATSGRFRKMVKPVAVLAFVLLAVMTAVFMMSGKNKGNKQVQEASEEEVPRSFKQLITILNNLIEGAKLGNIGTIETAKNDILNMDIQDLDKKMIDFRGYIIDSINQGIKVEKDYQYISKVSPSLYRYEWNEKGKNTLEGDMLAQYLNSNVFQMLIYFNQYIANDLSDSFSIQKPYKGMKFCKGKISRVEVSEDTFKWVDKTNKPDPVVFFGIREGDNFFPFDKTSVVQDTYNAVFNYEFYIVIPKEDELFVMLYDWDDLTSGDMMDYVALPEKNHSGLLKMAKGSSIYLTVEYDEK